ncbi:hypothetical protein [Kribbella sp. NPDC000426]|uniref:hypothetical protein n=1 Tax=Kribbella sp. NPDC000426 TaxID=3154255 RepID=UPI003332AA2A
MGGGFQKWDVGAGQFVVDVRYPCRAIALVAEYLQQVVGSPHLHAVPRPHPHLHAIRRPRHDRTSYEDAWSPARSTTAPPARRTTDAPRLHAVRRSRRTPATLPPAVRSTATSSPARRTATTARPARRTPALVTTPTPYDEHMVAAHTPYDDHSPHLHVVRRAWHDPHAVRQPRHHPHAVRRAHGPRSHAVRPPLYRSTPYDGRMVARMLCGGRVVAWCGLPRGLAG